MNFELNVEIGETTQFQFGSCSLFDITVELDDEAPFEVPVPRYLDEMLIGIRGAPARGGNATITWQRLKRIIETEATRDVCLHLFWIMMGVVFKRVNNDVIPELRQGLAKSWALVVLEVRKVASEGERGTEAETQEWLLRYVPVVLTQCLYRLLVDAFHDDRAKIIHLGDDLLEKITRVVFYEVSGFKLNSSTWEKERKKIFRNAVLELPHVNQHDSLKSQIRRENLEKRNKEPLALGFGSQDAMPLDEEQIEHIMINRAAARLKSSDPAAGSSQEIVPEELKVERYASIFQAGDRLFERQLRDLKATTAAEDSQNASRRPSHSRLEEAGFHLGSDALRSSLVGVSGGGNYVTKLRGKREAEQAQKRQREDALQKLILQDPLPSELCERSLDTAWVSPIYDRLVPVLYERQGLQKRSADSRKVTMELPAMMLSQSEPSLRKPVKLPQLSGQLGASGGHDDSQALTQQAEKKTIKTYKTELVLQPPQSLKNAVVLNRLSEHLVHYNARSFSNYSKDFDISTGVKKQRMDPSAMRRAENNYVATLHGLVGPATQPALKLYDSPERLAKRRAMKNPHAKQR